MTRAHAVVYEIINGVLIKSASRRFPAGLSLVTVTGLKPETDYEVKMSAINGKGEGENSLAVVFKTEHVREYHILLSQERIVPVAQRDCPLTSSTTSVKSWSGTDAEIYRLCC